MIYYMIYLLRWISIYLQIIMSGWFSTENDPESHDLEILWKHSSYGFQLSRRLNGRSTVGGLL